MENSLEVGHKALQLWNSEARVLPHGFENLACHSWYHSALIPFFIKFLKTFQNTAHRFYLQPLVTKWLAPVVGIETLSGFVGLCHLLFWSPGWVLLIREKFKPNNESKRKVYLAWS